MGFQVVVFSGNPSKADEASTLGAHEFVNTRDPASLGKVKPVDRMLITTSFLPDWDRILPMIARRGSIFPLTGTGQKIAIPCTTLIDNGLSIHGSMVASLQVHGRMLRFAAHHGIKPITALYPMTVQGIESALNDLQRGSVRYRAVLIPNQEFEKCDPRSKSSWCIMSIWRGKWPIWVGWHSQDLYQAIIPGCAGRMELG